MSVDRKSRLLFAALPAALTCPCSSRAVRFPLAQDAHGVTATLTPTGDSPHPHGSGEEDRPTEARP